MSHNRINATGTGSHKRKQKASVAWTPNSVDNCIGWWHADDAIDAQYIATSHSQRFFVPRLGDSSGNGRHMNSGSNAAAPMYNTTELGGSLWHRTANGTQFNCDTSTNSIAYWRNLHNGNGCTVVGYCKPYGTGSEHVLWNTWGGTWHTGQNVFYDGVNQKWCAKVRNASGGGTTPEIISISGDGYSAPPGNAYVVSFTYKEGNSPEAVLRVNGVTVASGNTTGAPNTGNSVGSFGIGRFSGAAAGWFDGYIRTVAVWDRVLTDAELATVEANFTTLQAARPMRYLWTVGDSISACTYQQYINLRMYESNVMMVDFLGSANAGEIGLYTDRASDGWSAHTCLGIKTKITGVAANFAHSPTDVIVIAGTNDINTGTNVNTVLTDFQSLIAQVRTEAPNAKLWIGRPPRRTLTGVSETESYAILLQKYAATLSNCEYIDTDVDLASEISGDGVHPATAGYATIGNKISNYLGI